MAFTIIYQRQAVEDAKKLKSEEPNNYKSCAHFMIILGGLV